MNNKSDSNDAIFYLEKGNSCFNSKKFEEAIENYNKTIALNPNVSTVYVLRGNAYASLKKHEEAIEDYDKAADLDPNNPKIYSYRGYAYAELEKYEEAIKDFNEAIKLGQNDPKIYYNRGSAYGGLEKYEEAIKDYNKAIALDPNGHPGIYFNRGLAYYNMSKYEEAIKDYDKATALAPTLSAAYFNRGSAYYKMSKYEEAIKDYNKAADFDPDVPDIYLNRGNAYYNLEKYEEAIRDYGKAADLNPDDPTIYYNRGNAYTKLEKYEEAIKDYDKAIALDPTLSAAYLINRGSAYGDLEKYEEAIKDYDKAADLDRNNPKIYLGRGNAYFNLEKYEEAIKDYDKAAGLDRNNPKIYSYRGNVYAKLEKYEEAIKDYNTAADLDHDNPDIYFYRGSTYANLGKYEEAIEDYDKAIYLDPDDPDIYLNRGNAYYNSDKYEEATNNYKEAIKNYKKVINNIQKNKYDSKYNSAAIFFIGFTFFQLKEYKECNKYLLEYLKLDKTEYIISKRSINHMIGESYIHLNNYEKGTDYLSQTQKDPIEFLSIYENIKQMHDVTSLLIGKSPECRFNRIIASINDKEELVKSYKNIYLSILKIIYSLLIKDDKEYFFAHYTTRKVASQLIFDKSPLRLSSALTTNDPTEGKSLMTYLDIDTLRANPDTNNPKDKNDFQAFIGCFSFNKESLNQFRLYGKENSEEATGISIVLNNKFFSKDMSLDILPRKPKRDIKEGHEIMIDRRYPLFRCLYIDPDKNKVVSIGHSDDNHMNNSDNNDDNEINEKLEKISDFLSDIKTMLSKLENKDKDIIENLFLTLRYLAKHAAFKEEQECRIICIKDMDEDANKEKDKREIHFTEDYSRMYTKSLLST